VNLLLQGGSAVQLFKGLDTRQLKVSNDNMRNDAYDFQSVLSEKSYEQKEVSKSYDEPKSDEKLNKHEMTSRKRPEVRDAKDEKSTVRESKGKTTDGAQNDSKVEKCEDTEADKAVEAVKKLLKKLGMSDEDVESMLEMIPDDMMASLVQVIEELPQMTGFSMGDTELQSQLSDTIENLMTVLQEITTEISSMKDVPTEMLQTLEVLTTKLEGAQINLENMNLDDFAQIIEAVSSQENSDQTVESEIEVVDVKVVEVQPESQELKPESEIDIPKEVKADTETQDDSETSKEGGKEEASVHTMAAQSETAEQTPGQVDQSFSETMKIESTLIKNAQPMELTSGRVRLAQNIMNQVMSGARAQINPMENGQQIILKLRPEELGNVDLKLSVDKGILMAEFNVESQIVKETIESNMADLKQALEEKGYNIEGMQVSVGQEQTEQQGQFENRFFNQNTQRKYFFGTEDELPDFESINKSLAGLQSTFEYLG
jgi:flagellar hook-length control protein FliK